MACRESIITRAEAALPALLGAAWARLASLTSGPAPEPSRLPAFNAAMGYTGGVTPVLANLMLHI